MGKIIKEKDNIPIVDYFLVFSIIALTGFEFFFRAIELLFYVVGPISFITYKQRKCRITNNVTIFFGVLLFWCCVQYICGYSSIGALINFYIRFWIYYFTIASVGKNLGETTVRIIVFFAGISIILYTFTNVSPGIRSMLVSSFSFIKPMHGGIEEEISSNVGQSLIIYFIPRDHLIRNSGPFWEPGMFAVFINIALAINLLKVRKVMNRDNLILIIASLTTLSTSSYISTILILALYFLGIKRNLKSLFGLVPVAVGVLLFLNSDFGYAKIVDNSQDDEAYSRFGAMIYHLESIEKHPVIGTGFQSDNRSVENLISPNGITNVIKFWGIPFSIYLYVLWFLSSKRLIKDNGINNRKKISAIMVYVILLVVAFSQDVTTRHFYNILAIYPLIHLPNLKK